VAYYVPLGPRGILLRIGTSLIGVLNRMIYWRASRRRRLTRLLLPVKALLHEDIPSGGES
jgi:hypothetical protein